MQQKNKYVIMACALGLIVWAHAAPGVRLPTVLVSRPGEAGSVSGIQLEERLDSSWTAIAAPDSNPRRFAHGCCWDPIHDQIYSYGGTPNGKLGMNLIQCDRYDPVNNRWTSVAPMSTARDYIKGLCARGKVYAIGGMDNSGNPLTKCEAYNISTDSWSAIASIPVGVIAYQACAYRDSLLYVLGGTDAYNGYATTQIYNVLTDTWTTGTAMPKDCEEGDCDIVGDTIYFLGGFDRANSVIDTTIRKGGINPANPAQIAWSWGPTLPGGWGDSGRFSGPTVALNGKLYAFGGMELLYDSPPGREQSVGYVFDPGTQTWDTMPAYPMPVTNYCLATVRASAHEIYGLSGISGDSASPRYYRLSLALAVEGSKPTADYRMPLTPTVVRGVLELPLAACRIPLTASLLDISGRKVMTVHSGANDVSRLAPGVYFVWSATTPSLPAMSETLHSTYKVIITR